MVLEQPTEEQVACIYSKLSMSPEGIRRDVEYLKMWMTQQPHLPDGIDERILKNSLIFRKNSLEKVKESIDLMYSCKRLAPELFRHRDPCDPDMQNTFDNFFAYPLPRLSIDGSRIILIKLWSADPSLFDCEKAMKLILMSLSIRLLEDFCVDEVLVFDLRGFTMSHFSTLTVSLLKKFAFIVQKAFPIRQKAVHIIYAPPFFPKVLALFKPFLKKKLAERIHIYTEDLGEFLKNVPCDLLPEDYGGSLPSTKDIQGQWRKKLEDYREWLAQDETLCTDESKRPGRPKTPHDIFGFEGSFRKLTVD